MPELSLEHFYFEGQGFDSSRRICAIDLLPQPNSCRTLHTEEVEVKLALNSRKTMPGYIGTTVARVDTQMAGLKNLNTVGEIKTS